MEPLGWRSYECFSTEFRLLEFADPLAGLKGSIDEIIYLSLSAFEGCKRLRLQVRAGKSSKDQVSLASNETVEGLQPVTWRTELGG